MNKVILLDFWWVLCKEQTFLKNIKWVDINLQNKQLINKYFKSNNHQHQRQVNYSDMWGDIIKLFELKDTIEDIKTYHLQQIKNNINIDIMNYIKILSCRYDIILVTNIWQYVLEYILINLWYGNIFTHIIASSQIWYRKPEKEFFKRITDLINSYSEHIYLDDKNNNIKEAINNWIVNSFKFSLDNSNYKDFISLLNKNGYK